MAGEFPMAPIGGAFLATVGLAVMVGGLARQLRQRSIWYGLVLGAAVAIYSGTILFHPPPPTTVQIISLVVAIAAEVAAFVLLMPTLYRAGERAVVAGTLAIVGGHFILMLPAFGPLVGLLGILCLGNAWAVWKWRRYSMSLGWTLDGGIKLATGLLMLLGVSAGQA